MPTYTKQLENNLEINPPAKKIDRTSYLASKLSQIASQLPEDVQEYIAICKTGRKPASAAKDRVYNKILEASIYAAHIQVGMLRGDLPFMEGLFRACDSPLDRVLGKATTNISVSPNQEVLERLEKIGKLMELARQPRVLIEESNV